MIAALLVVLSLNLQARDTIMAEGQAMVALSAESATVKEVLESLEAQTKYRFFYNHKALSDSEKITLYLDNVSMEKALQELSARADLVFKIRGDQIVVKKKPAIPVLALFDRGAYTLTQAELERISALPEAAPVVDDLTVSGQVVDENNVPLPSVNIIIKGTNTGVTTDAEGRYNLTVPDEDAVLVFSFIGYLTQEIRVGSQTTINVAMVPDISTLSEIVVVGYGTQKRSSVTGAVSSVDSEEITALAVPSVQSALQGRVAGVNVTNNGSPGSTPIVRIRGIGSITGSSDPLYVVDGLPTSGLNAFDPRDIESVEVLKDAAAAAIYGSRAANGVILITTKKGAAGKRGMSVEIDSYYGVQNAWKTLDLLNREQYLQYGTELLTNAGSTLPPRFSAMNEPIYEGATQTYAQTDTDWQDAVFRAAPIYQVQASLSTSSEKGSMYASGGYYGQDGIMIGTDFQRYNFRFNSEMNISDRVQFGQTLTIASSKSNNLQESGGRTILQHVVHSVPYMPIYDPTKEGGFRAPDNNDGSDPENPVRIQLMDKNVTDVARVFGTAYVNVEILPFLTYRFTFGGDFYYSRNRIDQPIYNDGFGARLTHNLQDNRSTGFSPLYQNQLTFDKTFGKHSVNITAVAERQDTKVSGINASAQQNSNFIYSLQAGQNQTIGNNDSYETTLLSFLGRINYEFANKYLLSASIRRDGYSGFAPGHKWGNFPGVSVGWRISEEPFMASVTAITELKIRASYGSLGVNNVGPFDWQSLINLNSTYPFNNTNQGGAYFNSLPNNELSWEKTQMTNFGIDVGLFDNKLTFTAEYFQRKVDDLLLRVPLAPSMGYSVDYLGNVGKMENSGFELQAGYNKQSGNLMFNATANFGIVRNKVTDLYVPGNTIFAGSNADFGGFNITKTEAGHSVQGFYGWVVDGLFQSQAEIDAANAIDGDPGSPYQSQAAPGDIRFKDLDGNGVIDESDRTYIGSFLPDFTYGLNLTASYRNFDVTLFIQGVHGNEVYNGTKVLTQGMLRLFGAETAVLDAWTPENPDTDVPRAVNGDPNQNSRTSTRFIDDGSYMRIKNLNIGYSLPADVLSSFAGGSIRKLRIYASFQNLLTLTNYTGYDPEIGYRTANNLIQGIDYGQYPQPRTIMGGIQIGF
jgi:TonB-linked SusC/RagA family outer membrane protein